MSWEDEYLTGLQRRDLFEQSDKELVNFYTHLADEAASLSEDLQKLRDGSKVEFIVPPELVQKEANPKRHSGALPMTMANRFTSFLGATTGLVAPDRPAPSSSDSPADKPAPLAMNGNQAHLISRLRASLSAAQAARAKYEKQLDLTENKLKKAERDRERKTHTISRLERLNSEMIQKISDQSLEIFLKSEQCQKLQLEIATFNLGANEARPTQPSAPPLRRTRNSRSDVPPQTFRGNP